MSSLSRLLATTALVAASSLLLVPAAYADCQPDPAAAGQTVTCTGTDFNGFASGGVNQLTVNVVSGAAVTAPAGDIISVNNQSVVNNAGTIIGANFSAGINANNFNTITNSGQITATNSAFAGISVNDNNTVTNTGTISVRAGQGIRGHQNNTIVNAGTIIVNGTLGEGIEVTNPGNVITNSGLIAVTGNISDGVLFFADGTLTNSGVIIANAASGATAVAAGVGVAPTVTNTGTIDGRVSIAVGQLINNGLLLTSTGLLGQTHGMAQFTQNASGTLAVRVNPALQHDQLIATTSATLGGTLRATVQPGLYAAAQRYFGVIQSGGLSGAFASVVTTSPFLAGATVNNGTNVDLILTRIAFNAIAGLTQNQSAVAGGLEAGYSTALTGDAATIYSLLFTEGSAATFDRLSGEVATGVQNPSFALGAQFHGALLGQAQRWRAGQAGAPGQQVATGAYRVQVAAAQPEFGVSLAQAAPTGTAWPPRSVGTTWAAWASGFGLTGSRDGDATVGSARLSYSTGGGAFGADVQLAPNLLLGAAVGAGASSFTLDGRSQNGDVRTVYFGLYGSWTMGPLYVDLGASYGHGQFSTTRIATLGSFGERATGDFDGNQYGGRLEAGWRFRLSGYELTPFAGVNVQALHQNAYSESSVNLTTNAPGILGLSYAGETTTSVRSFVGGQVQATWRLADWATVTPRVRVAWAHEFNDDRQVSASFLSIPGAAFTVNGARPARDAAIVGAGVDLGIGRNVALYAQFDGDLSGGGNAYAGSGGVRISW